MRYYRLLTLPLLLSATVCFAQGKITVVKKINGQVVEVQQHDKPIKPAFNSFAETDANSDGRINRTEARDAGILAFSVADLDGNGWLDEQEYDAVATGRTRLPASE